MTGVQTCALPIYKDFPQQFTNMEDFSRQNLLSMSEKVHDFTGLEVNSNIKIEFPDLKEFKLLKGKKVLSKANGRAKLIGLQVALM